MRYVAVGMALVAFLSGCAERQAVRIEADYKPVSLEIPKDSARQWLIDYTQADSKTVTLCDFRNDVLKGFASNGAGVKVYADAPIDKWRVEKRKIVSNKSKGSAMIALTIKHNYGTSNDYGCVVQARIIREIPPDRFDTVIAEEKAKMDKALQALYLLGVKVDGAAETVGS